MASTNLNYNENFSLTCSLTSMTNKWYQNSKAHDASFGSLFLGSIGSRIVNIVIIPTALIDTISHLAVGILTIGFAAPAGKIYNFIQWNMDSDLRSRFSFAGGIINFMHAKKFDVFLGVVAGCISPEKIALYFSSHEGRTQKEIHTIFQNEITYCENIIAKDKFGTSTHSQNLIKTYQNVITILHDSSQLDLRIQNISLENHEEFSLTRLLTNTTNKWHQKSKNDEAGLGTLTMSFVASRFVNLFIIPVSLIDSICNVAIGIFTLTIGAPLGKIYNAFQWCLNSKLRTRFSFAGGIINIMNAKNHLINAPLATFTGLLNPEKAAYFFKSSQRKTKEESNYPLRVAIENLIYLKTLNNFDYVKTACDTRIDYLSKYLIR